MIIVQNGMVSDFQMNDKCSAGTGKFLEIMANRLGVTINELFDMAAAGEVIPISSLCTVFAESEVINYIGEGKKREDIAAGVVDSVANKVVQLAQKKELGDRVILTGGLSHSIYFTGILSDKLDQKVESEEFGRFCGGIRGSTSCQRKERQKEIMKMELIKDLPEVFEEFAEQRQKSFLAVKELKRKRCSGCGVLLYIFPERDCNGDGSRMCKPLLDFG